MFSPFYYYFEIRGNSKYTKSTQVKALKNFLEKCPELQEENYFNYSNSPDFPWLSIFLTTASENGSYPVADASKDEINLLAVVGSKKNSDEDRKRYDKLLIKIAKYLSWEYIEEANEEGEEAVKIWSPSGNINQG